MAGRDNGERNAVTAPPRKKKLTYQLVLRFTQAEGAHLEQIAREGGYASTAQCARCMVRSILVDEAASGPLPRHVVNEGERVSTSAACE